jgi:cellulose synthase/poly-beta-1,6-N-acetylglucosamine synthase-like glycosyltransferase
MPQASVVIPAGRRDRIDRCLDSLLTMDLRDFETIVVVKPGFAYSHKDSRVRVVEQTGKGVSDARNCGIRQARGKIIAFTDDDCVVSRRWLSSLLSAFDDPEVGGAGSIREAYNPHELIASLWDASYVIPGSLVQKYNYLRDHDTFLCTSSAAYRAEVIKGLAGFDESLPAGEDYDLSVRVKRSGFKLSLVPEARVWHEHPSTLKSVLRQQLWHAQGDIALAKKYARKAIRLRLLMAIPYSSLASVPYSITHGVPMLPAFVFFRSASRFAGSLMAPGR